MALRFTTSAAAVAIVLLAGLPCTLLGVPVADGDNELAELIIEYEAAKTQWQEWKKNQGRRQGGRGGFGPGGGGPGRGGFGRRESAPALAPILEKIAKLNSAPSLKYLTKEYQEAEPEIAAMCAAAMLESEHENRATLVVRGFDPRGQWTLGAKARVLDALAKTRAEGGLEFVLKLATKGKLEPRALALGSLHLRSDSDEVLTVLLRALEDRAPSVRKAALRSLAAFQDKTVIGTLVGHLEKEKEEQLRIDTLRLLVKFTGQNFGLTAADWQKWWDTAATTFEFNAKREGNTVVITPDLKYFGIEVASKRVSFLVDASGSMEDGGGPGGGRGRGGPGGGGGGGRGRGDGKAKIDLLKDELSRILKELPDDTHVNIIAFHRTPVPWQKELQVLKGPGRDAAVRFVRGLTTDFGTNIYDTLELALGDTRVDTIFLLSDGQPYGGKYTEPDDILREIGAINRVRGARIHCLGFGDDTQLLKDLADQNGGDFRRIEE